MWYIVDADEGAGIYLGFKESISREEFERAIKDKTLTDYLQFIPVKKGDCYFIPAGTIHAICEGCLICEIQQNSNITYRVYDYGRVGADGKERQLHVDKALDVTNTEKFVPKQLDLLTAEGRVLGISRFFTATLVSVSDFTNFSKDDATFRHFTCLDGEGSIGGVSIKKGESLFVPAGYEAFVLEGKFTAIMTTVRRYSFSFYIDDGYLNGKIVDDRGMIVCEETIPMYSTDDDAKVLKQRLLDMCNLTMSDIYV